MNDISQFETLLDSMPKALLEFIKHSKQVQAELALVRRLIGGNPQVFLDLEALEIEPLFGPGYINLYFTGDGPKLAKVWAILRKGGFKPRERPKAGETKSEFSTWWDKEGEKEHAFYMHFSSEVCRRVQIGTCTRTIEEPIYEVQCGDVGAALSEDEPRRALPGDNEPSVLGQLLSDYDSGDSNDIPF